MGTYVNPGITLILSWRQSGIANLIRTGRNQLQQLYLAYNSEEQTARIPNEEIRLEFLRSVHEVTHEATLKMLRESEQLFWNTVNKNENAVAEQKEACVQDSGVYTVVI